MKPGPIHVGRELTLSTAAWTLFLDFDGVINSEPFLRAQRNHVAPGDQRLFAPENLRALHRLCADLPVAAIIVTSTWQEGRSVAELRGLLAREGFPEAMLVDDVTGNGASTGEARAREILRYAEQNDLARWLVLDDLTMSALGSRLFQTSAARGLTEADVDHILAQARGG